MQLRSLLRAHGRLFVTVPAYQWLWSEEDDYATHFRRYTAWTLRRELQTAGFVVEHVTYMFAFLPLAILLFRSLPYRLGRRRPFTAANVERDHAGAGGLSKRLLGAFMRLELRIAAAGLVIPFGGSVVAVARNAG